MLTPTSAKRENAEDTKALYNLYVALFAHGRPPAGSVEEAAMWGILDKIEEHEGLALVWGAKLKFQLMGGEEDRARAVKTLRTTLEWAVEADKKEEFKDQHHNAHASIVFGYLKEASACGALGLHLDNKLLLHRALAAAPGNAARWEPRTWDLEDAAAVESVAQARERGWYVT